MAVISSSSSACSSPLQQLQLLNSKLQTPTIISPSFRPVFKIECYVIMLSKHLPLNEWCRLASTCKTFHSLSILAVKKTRKLDTRIVPNRQVNGILSVVRRFGLKLVHINFWSGLSGKDVISFVKNCPASPTLTKLTVNGYIVSESCIHDIAVNCPNLRHLRYCGEIDESHISELATKCPLLRVLIVLPYSNNPSAICFEEVIRHNRITCLALYKFIEVTDLLRIVHKHSVVNASLTELTLQMCYLFNLDLKYIALKFPNLAYLDLRANAWITDDGIIHLKRRKLPLKRVSLIGTAATPHSRYLLGSQCTVML